MRAAVFLTVLLVARVPAQAGCLINAIGTQLLVDCQEPEPDTHWRGGLDDREATRWRSKDSPASRPMIRRFEEVGSTMQEMEPTTQIHMLKVR